MSLQRIILIVGGAGLLASVALDPYTLYSSASDAAIPAPWWQTAIAGADALLIIGFLVFVWRLQDHAAALSLSTAILVNLFSNIGYVQRDGVARFLLGYGAEEYLSVYLLFMSVRILLLVWVIVLGAASRKPMEVYDQPK